MINAISSPAVALFICLSFHSVMGQTSCPSICRTCSVVSRNGLPYYWCSTCYDGYGLYLSSCYACPSNCKTCAGSTYPLTCSTCNDGYALSSVDGSCAPCDANCQICTNYYRQCTSCQSNTYRDPNPPYAACLTCDSCAAGEYERFFCSFSSNRYCVACAQGSAVINNQCVACTAGVTYTSSDRKSCQPCTVCQNPTEYLANGNECTTSRNTICSTCSNNKATSGPNLATCDTCASGYFMQASGTTFVCESCTANPCAQNQYISCANARRQCLTCPGVTLATACAAGNEPDKTCDGSSTTPSKCRECLAGSERPSGSSSLICEKCKTGFYKTGQSSSDCGRCTNAPQSNSTYLVWGNTPAVTTDCPW